MVQLVKNNFFMRTSSKINFNIKWQGWWVLDIWSILKCTKNIFINLVRPNNNLIIA